jgi:hypothetical protein
VSITARLQKWLAELDAVASQADEGDGWHLTEAGREKRDIARQRAEDLRTLIDAATLD